jgi:hypothetical protein
MRKLLCLALLAACELQPPPKQKPAPTAPPSAATTMPSAPPAEAADAGAPAGATAPKPAISAECIEVATRVAQVFIDSAKDPAQRTVLEQERANMTRKTGEACTAQAWSDDARACFLKSKTPAELQACEMQFMPPPPKKPTAPDR